MSDMAKGVISRAWDEYAAVWKRFYAQNKGRLGKKAIWDKSPYNVSRFPLGYDVVMLQVLYERYKLLGGSRKAYSAPHAYLEPYMSVANGYLRFLRMLKGYVMGGCTGQLTFVSRVRTLSEMYDNLTIQISQPYPEGTARMILACDNPNYGVDTQVSMTDPQSFLRAWAVALDIFTYAFAKSVENTGMGHTGILSSPEAVRVANDTILLGQRFYLEYEGKLKGANWSVRS